MTKNYFLICLGLLCFCTGCIGTVHAEELEDAPGELDFLNPGNLQEIPEEPENLEISEDSEIVPEEPEIIPEIQEIPETVPETVPENPLRERAEAGSSESAFLIDENQHFSESDFAYYEEFLRNQNLHVLITDHLDGYSPEQFARYYYQALCGDSDGILILINNDTYQDSYYLSGSYNTEYYAEQVEIALLQATPCLVEGRFADALDRLFFSENKIV